MSIQTEHKVAVKMFIGCHLSSEIRMYLNQSEHWKQATIMGSKRSNEDLVEVHYQARDYIGCYLASEMTCLSDLRELEKVIKTKLRSYCPTFDFDHVKIAVFPQVFLT